MLHEQGATICFCHHPLTFSRLDSIRKAYVVISNLINLSIDGQHTIPNPCSSLSRMKIYTFWLLNIEWIANWKSCTVIRMEERSVKRGDSQSLHKIWTNNNDATWISVAGDFPKKKQFSADLYVRTMCANKRFKSSETRSLLCGPRTWYDIQEFHFYKSMRVSN